MRENQKNYWLTPVHNLNLKNCVCNNKQPKALCFKENKKIKTLISCCKCSNSTIHENIEDAAIQWNNIIDSY